MKSFDRAEMIVKVKEPQQRSAGDSGRQILFTYLHLAPDPEQTRISWKAAQSASLTRRLPPGRGCRCSRPCPKSRAHVGTGRRATTWKEPRADGILLAEWRACTGQNVILGAGVSARTRAGSRWAAAPGWWCWTAISARCGPSTRYARRNAHYGFSNHDTIERHVLVAPTGDRAVLDSGRWRRTHKLVSLGRCGRDETGPVWWTCAIDQGCCFETSRPTNACRPTYIVDRGVHYCVANMPGGVTAHFGLRPQQCHPALRAHACRPGPPARLQTTPTCAPGSTSATARSTAARSPKPCIPLP